MPTTGPGPGPPSLQLPHLLLSLLPCQVLAAQLSHCSPVNGDPPLGLASTLGPHGCDLAWTSSNRKGMLKVGHPLGLRGRGRGQGSRLNVGPEWAGLAQDLTRELEAAVPKCAGGKDTPS